MNEWVQILSVHWYRTLSTHDIIWVFLWIKQTKVSVLCDLELLRRVYDVISRYWTHIQRIYTFLNKVGSCDQNFVDTTKMSSMLYYCVHSRIYNYLPCGRQSKLTRVIRETLLSYIIFLKYISSNPYISNIHNTDQNSDLAPQKICDHMFSDIKSDHTLHVFWLCTWHLFSSSRMWQLSTYFEYGKVVKSTIGWFLSEFNGLQTEYYLPPINKPNLKYSS